MNKDRLALLADTIEVLEHKPDYTKSGGFCLNFWKFSCGAPACNAGWAEHLAWQDESFNLKAVAWLGTQEIAQRWLEISEEEAFRLFTPHLPNDELYEDVTPQRSAAVIRRFIETGHVEWSE